MQSAKKREIVIGMVLEDIYTDFSKELIQGVLGAISPDSNIRLVVLAGRYDHGDGTFPDHVYKTVYNTIFKLSELCELDGLIIHMGSVDSQRGEKLVEKQLERYKSVPKVFIACDNPDLLTVNYDNETGIRQAVDTLVNVNGLTRLCMLGGRDDNTDAQLRKEIFARCLKDNGIEFTDQNYVHSGMHNFTERPAAELLDKNPDVQAIFCVNDAVAKGLYNVMEQRGLLPGRDILIFGFDNTHMAGEMIPSLSSVGLADCTLGQKALELLLDKIHGEQVTSALVPTRLYGRQSLPHEMYDYNSLELQNVETQFIYRMFDDCFYRYKSESRSRESVDLRRLFYEFISRMLGAIKRRYMSQEEFEEIGSMIDKFFEKGAMHYTDAVKLITSTDKLVGGVNTKMHGANMFVNRLFVRIRERAILALSEQNIQDAHKHDVTRQSLQQFLINGVVYANTKQTDRENVIRNLHKLGIRNAALFMYDEPVVFNGSDRAMFPEYVRLRCVIRSGEVYILPSERQKCEVREMFTRVELPTKCRGFVALPIFYRDFIYGLFLCELTQDIYDSGEYIALELGRTVYLNDEQTVIKLANTDTLTGLYNRRFFYNYLSGVIKEPFHLIYIDLDYFKAVNDNFGHATGDAVLVRAADMIKEYFPGSLIARLGGDEFIVKFDTTDHSEVERICGELEVHARQEFESYGCGTSLSWGYVYTDGNGFDIDKLIQQSDLRMYESKRSKR